MYKANNRYATPLSSDLLPPALASADVPALVVDRLCKTFDGNSALNGLSFRVRQGAFVGLLGPHGSGKSTLARILATVLRPDTGRAAILGHDVRADAHAVRRSIGYMAQGAGVDPQLTAREQLLLLARLYGLSSKEAEKRCHDALLQLGLTAISDRRAIRYPVEARRRLALARSLVHRPRVLLLDDPADGLSAHERMGMLQCLEMINREDAITILLAAPYLEEAEGLCSEVVIIDAGRLVATGTPAELKAQVTGSIVTIRLLETHRLGEVAALLAHLPGVRGIRPQRDRLELYVSSAGSMPILLRLLEEHEIPLRDIVLSRSSLDEVFFRHTGRRMQDLGEKTSSGSEVPGHR